MIETILIIIIATALGLYNETNKPTQYELKMEDGSHTLLVLQKNNIYACPLHCEVEHVHQAVICKNDSHNKKYQFLRIYLKTLYLYFQRKIH